MGKKKPKLSFFARHQSHCGLPILFKSVIKLAEVSGVARVNIAYVPYLSALNKVPWGKAGFRDRRPRQLLGVAGLGM